MSRKNPPASGSLEIDPNTISRADFMALVRESVQRAGSQPKLAVLLGVNTRTIERWLKGDGPSQNKMVTVFVNMRNINWSEAQAELNAIKDRSRTIQQG